MNKLKMILAGLLIVPTVALAVAPAASAQSDFNIRTGAEAAQGEGAVGGVSDPNTLVKNFVNVFLWVVGILSVVMLIWGGVRYTTSAGDSNKVTAAKNTVMYAVIGLVVSILAYAIVNFVLNQIGTAAS